MIFTVKFNVDNQADGVMAVEKLKRYVDVSSVSVNGKKLVIKKNNGLANRQAVVIKNLNRSSRAKVVRYAQERGITGLDLKLPKNILIEKIKLTFK